MVVNIAGEESCFTSEILCETISGVGTSKNVRHIGHNVAQCDQALTMPQWTKSPPSVALFQRTHCCRNNVFSNNTCFGFHSSTHKYVTHCFVPTDIVLSHAHKVLSMTHSVKCYLLANAKLCPPPHPIREMW